MIVCENCGNTILVNAELIAGIQVPVEKKEPEAGNG